MTPVDHRSARAATLAARAELAAVSFGAWPDPGAPQPHEPPAVAGFVGSSFSPLVVEAAARCLHLVREPLPVGGSGAVPAPLDGPRTAIVIVSESGDVATATSVAGTVDSGGRLGPLLFFASVPNAVAGYVAARWGLTGPVVCLSPLEDALAEGFAAAFLLIRDGDADEALVVHVEQAMAAGERDQALAVLVRANTPAEALAIAEPATASDIYSGGIR
jgi:hypothetical protein